MIGLLISIAIAIAAAGPIALVVALMLRTRLSEAERRIAALQTEVSIAQSLALRASQSNQATQSPPEPPARPVPDFDSSQQDQARTPVEPPPVPEWALPRPAAAAPPPAPAPVRPRQTFEERLGAHWTVWVGGVALALGGLLLVRYSIEQGYFGPAARCVLGLVFGFALAAAGEFLRRREKSGALTPTPAILTGAGTVVAFGAIYAAHGLYGLIGSPLAFIALGATAVAAILSAALHGPALAGLGLVGACAAPLLVSSSQPNPWPVVLYIAVATGAAYALARIRRWLWLACAAAAGAALWALLFGAESSTSFYHAALVQTLVSAALASAFVAVLPHLATGDAEAEFDPVATAVVGVFALVLCLILWNGLTYGRFDLATVLLSALLVAGLAATGAVIAPSAALTPIAGGLAAAVLWLWIDDLTKPVQLSTIATLYEPLEPTRFAVFASATGFVVAGFGGRRLATGRALSTMLAGLYAGAAAVTPLVLLAIAYLRLARSEESPPFAIVAGVLAAVFIMAAHYFRRGESADAPPATRLALGAFATAALAALALGFVFVFDKGVLTVALALAALGAAAVAARLDIAGLRYSVAAMGFVVLGRLAWEPRIIGADLGTTPVFNWLLFGYGVPALAFGLAARLMRRADGEDLPVRVAQSLCILFAGLLAFFEIRHALNGGDIYAESSRLIEQGLFATAALLFSIVLTRLDLMRSSPVFRIASIFTGVLSAAIAVGGLLLLANPYYACEPVEGGRWFNALLLSYGVPAILAAVLMRFSRGARPEWFTQGAGVMSLALLFAYACLQTRRLFHDSNICIRDGHDQVEIWAYSAVWLALGALLLLYGVFRRMQGARLASGVFVLAATLKVFLYDLSGLEGLMRALSFIGLGLILIGIGLLYQKLVFGRRPAGESPGPDPVV